MTIHTVLYDACVLYPAPLRDLLMHLALTGLFRAKWTEAIQEEWVRNLLENRSDLTREQLARTCSLMNEAVPDCLIAGYEDLITTLSLPDLDDRHVLAAAIRGGADAIVTYNLSDFPAEALKRHGIAAQHPDEFISRLLDLAPDVVYAAAKRHWESLRKPPKNAEDYLATLECLGLAQTVARLREVIALL